ncbi:MAG: oxidoreductase [Cyanobium sp. NAT70]|nr:oxidoreductase [Cyanobium sp. NAT70]|tara:strand:- start:3404 stop:4792 length:1389 start_codon:yes stop_codon:yes gene_type:complete
MAFVPNHCYVAKNTILSMQKSLLKINEPDYEQCLADLFNGHAAAASPSCIVQPRTNAELQQAIRWCFEEDRKICIRGGGHSKQAAVDGAVMLDLSKHLHQVTLLDDGVHVKVQGGCNMGQLLRVLKESKRMVPVGTHPTPGFGLLCMGGIGHIGRSHGLTIDHICELRGWRSNGEPFLLHADKEDGNAWQMMRGAAIFLGIIGEATLKTSTRQPLQVKRTRDPLDRLWWWIQTAESLPKSWSCSLILGTPPDQNTAAVLAMAVSTMSDDSTTETTDLPHQWMANVNGQEELPNFNLPLQNGESEPEQSMTTSRYERLKTRNYSLSIPKGHGKELSDRLTMLMHQRPNQHCRIDLQHIGGAIGEIPIEETAYTGRGCEWSLVICGVSPPGCSQDDTDQANQWADQAFDLLRPMAQHCYIVERHPDSPIYQEQLKLAYGPLLEPLKQLKHQWDPYNRLALLETQ